MPRAASIARAMAVGCGDPDPPHCRWADIEVAARKGIPPADSCREVFGGLVRAGLMAPDLARRLEGWAGLRDVLAHRYARIAMERLGAILRGELPDIDEFLAWIAGLR